MTTGEAVTGVVDALKSQPLSLALVVMNIALLALFYIIVQSSEHRHKVNSEQRECNDMSASLITDLSIDGHEGSRVTCRR